VKNRHYAQNPSMSDMAFHEKAGPGQVDFDLLLHLAEQARALTVGKSRNGGTRPTYWAFHLGFPFCVVGEKSRLRSRTPPRGKQTAQGCAIV
jgi:hypothetical protein